MPTKIAGFVCESCGSVVRKGDECVVGIYECDECGQVYEDEKNALECCKEESQ